MRILKDNNPIETQIKEITKIEEQTEQIIEILILRYSPHNVDTNK